MMANENAGNGAGQEEACGAQRVARQGYENGAGGRGPLLLSGYRGGEPYYLYADGTAPAKSKVAARPIVRDGGVARRAGAQRAALHASLHAAQGDGQLGIRGQAHGGGDAKRAVFARALALSPTRSPRGAPPGLPGTVHAARHGGKGAVETAALRGSEEERRRMRTEVVAAVAQATIRHRAGRQAGSSGDEQRGGSSQLGKPRGQHGELAELDSTVVRLQLEEAITAIMQLQEVVDEQQARITAIENGGGAETGERREARWPRLAPSVRRTGARSLAAAFDAAVDTASPLGEACTQDLERQSEQWWQEVSAAQADYAVAQAAAVEAEPKVDEMAAYSVSGLAAAAESEADPADWAAQLWSAAEGSWPSEWMAAAAVAAGDNIQAAGRAETGSAMAGGAVEKGDLSDRVNAPATDPTPRGERDVPTRDAL